LHLPQVPPSASRSADMRFAVWQWGQTTIIDSAMVASIYQFTLI
jgi:hypothetical protein